MYSLKSPFLGQFAQVTPDRVFGNAQFLAQRFRNQLTVLPKPLQEKLLSLSDEHWRRPYAICDQSARKYMNMHETPPAYARNCGVSVRSEVMSRMRRACDGWDR